MIWNIIGLFIAFFLGMFILALVSLHRQNKADAELKLSNRYLSDAYKWIEELGQLADKNYKRIVALEKLADEARLQVAYYKKKYGEEQDSIQRVILGSDETVIQDALADAEYKAYSRLEEEGKGQSRGER